MRISIGVTFCKRAIITIIAVVCFPQSADDPVVPGKPGAVIEWE